MYSLTLTARALFKGELDTVDPQRLKQAKIGLHDILVALLAAFLGSMLMQDAKKSKHDDTKLSQYPRLGSKILYNATSEFNPFTNLAGPFNGEPSFMKKMGEVKTGFMSLMSGNTTPEKFLRNNLNFLEVVPTFETRK